MASSKYITIFIFGILSTLMAQPHGGGDYGKQMGKGCEISGSVIDSLTSIPIEYTSISVMGEDNQVVTGGVTNSQGKFHIEKIRPGNYSLKIEFMGYAPVIISEISLSFRGSRTRDIGIIKLQPSAIELKAVKVIDDKPIFEFETDKLIYNSSDDIIADSGTAEDVLNKVPMVVVDQDGEVTLRGNPNVKILVNGRPNRTGEGSNDVDNIPASLIDRVEVITSPSAKYDPDGMAGIINIVLKKGKYEGLNGSIKINGKHNTYGSIDEMNGFTTYGNYKGEKWNLYSSLSLNNRLRNMVGYRWVDTEYDATIVLPDSTEFIHYDFTNESDRVGHSVKFGADYSITDQLIVNGEVNYNVHLRNGVNNQNNILPLPKSVRITKDNDLDDNYNLEGFFEINKTYDNLDRELIFSSSSNFKKDNGYKILDLDSTYLEQDISEIQMDFSYKYPLNENSKLEFGYDGKFTDNNENMNFQITADEGVFSGENTFGYNRNIHGLFFEFDYILNDKFSIKPSIRYEYVSKEILFNSKNIVGGELPILYAELLTSLEDTIDLDYETFYPNLHFTYNITEKQSLQFGLSKRVNRPGEGGHGPGSRQIRPFPRDVYSENFIFMGNPFLKPEYSTQYELSFKSPIPMGFAYTNLYYHQLENVIEWYDLDTLSNGQLIEGDVLTFVNAASGENMGIEFFTMIMGQTLGGGYNLSKLDDPTGDYELNGNSQRIMLYNRINFPEKYIKYFDFEFGFFFMKMTVPGGDLFGAKGTLWANTGISKSFMEERFSISLGINNLFDAGGFQMKREKPLIGPFTNGYFKATEFTDVSTSRHGRTFTLNIKYRFGQMQKERDRNRPGQNKDGDGSMDMGY